MCAFVQIQYHNVPEVLTDKLAVLVKQYGALHARRQHSCHKIFGHGRRTQATLQKFSSPCLITMQINEAGMGMGVSRIPIFQDARAPPLKIGRTWLTRPLRNIALLTCVTMRSIKSATIGDKKIRKYTLISLTYRYFDRISEIIFVISNETRSSADADKPARRVYRSVKVTKHSTIPYVRYSFLLCNSNSKNVVTLKSGSEVTQGH